MGPIIDRGKDCDGVGIVRGKRYVYPAKTDPTQPSTTTTPVGRSHVEWGTLHDIIPEVNTD